jgi:hypothetical protein
MRLAIAALIVIGLGVPLAAAMSPPGDPYSMVTYGAILFGYGMCCVAIGRFILRRDRA